MLSYEKESNTNSTTNHLSYAEITRKGVRSQEDKKVNNNSMRLSSHQFLLTQKLIKYSFYN